MGSWGTGIYENDEALDLLGQLEDPQLAQKITRKKLQWSFSRVIWLSAHKGSELLSLAAVSVGNIPEEIEGHTNYQKAVRNVEMLMTARRYKQLEKLVHRVIYGPRSELLQPEYWVQPGDLDLWLSSAGHVHKQLKQKVGDHFP